MLRPSRDRHASGIGVSVKRPAATRWIRSWGAIACFLAMLVVPAVASAAPDTQYEPNDGIDTAYGPLAAGTNYDARIDSHDSDWYVLYVSGQGVLDVAVTNIDDLSNRTVYMDLLDRDGYELNSTSASENNTEHLSYTTPGPGQYYVWVGGSSDSSPNDYRLSATGPLTTGPRPGPPDETVPNNNQDISTAYGPLLGDRLYAGRIDVNGEEDWFTFNTAGAGPFEIAMTNIDDESDATAYMTLLDADGNELDYTSAGEERIGRIQLTGAGPARYYLVMNSGYNGNRYQFRLTPGSMITTTPPPAPVQPASESKACLKASGKLDKFKAKLQRAKEKKRSANGKKAKKRAMKKIKKVKAKVKGAKQTVKASC